MLGPSKVSAGAAALTGVFTLGLVLVLVSFVYGAVTLVQERDTMTCTRAADQITCVEERIPGEIETRFSGTPIRRRQGTGRVSELHVTKANGRNIPACLALGPPTWFTIDCDAQRLPGTQAKLNSLRDGERLEVAADSKVGDAIVLIPAGALVTALWFFLISALVLGPRSITLVSVSSTYLDVTPVWAGVVRRRTRRLARHAPDIVASAPITRDGRRWAITYGGEPLRFSSSVARASELETDVARLREALRRG